MNLLTKDELLNMKKIELQTICIKYNIPKSGTKDILSTKILEWYKRNTTKCRRCDEICVVQNNNGNKYTCSKCQKNAKNESKEIKKKTCVGCRQIYDEKLLFHRCSPCAEIYKEKQLQIEENKLKLEKQNSQPKIRTYPNLPRDIFNIVYKYCECLTKFVLNKTFGNIFNEVCSYDNCDINACRMSFCTDIYIFCPYCKQRNYFEEDDKLQFFCAKHYKSFIEYYDKITDNKYSYLQDHGECRYSGRRFMYDINYEMNKI
jgi:hypothetical protein